MPSGIFLTQITVFFMCTASTIIYPAKFLGFEKNQGFVLQRIRFLDQVVIDRAPGNILCMIIRAFLCHFNDLNSLHLQNYI